MQVNDYRQKQKTPLKRKTTCKKTSIFQDVCQHIEIIITPTKRVIKTSQKHSLHFNLDRKQ